MSIFEPITQCGCGKADCYFCNQRKLSPWIVPGLPQENVSMSVFNLQTPEDILCVVCQQTGADPDAVRSKSRKRDHVIPRQLYCFAARTATKATLVEIGKIIERTHATVLYSCNEVEYKRKNDKPMKDVYEKVKGFLTIN